MNDPTFYIRATKHNEDGLFPFPAMGIPIPKAGRERILTNVGLRLTMIAALRQLGRNCQCLAWIKVDGRKIFIDQDGRIHRQQPGQPIPVWVAAGLPRKYRTKKLNHA